MKYLRSLTLVMGLALLVASTPMVPNYGVGDTVSDFKLKNVDGKMVSLSDYKNSKGVIVIFDCNTCPYSKAYNQRIIALNKKLTPVGFPVVTINSNDPEVSPGDSFDDMVYRAKQSKYDFPYLIDETQSVARAFGATNTPHVFLLKKEGNDFKVAYIGAIDDSARNPSSVSKKYVEEAVEAIVAGKPVPVTKTKAIGCGIKWKDA
ncbi:MAG: thioredoxin family protein [Bacteroidota bacterium]